jgi:signal peptidase I
LSGKFKDASEGFLGRSTVADWNWVPTGSMKPTILEGDMVFVNKLPYDLTVPVMLSRGGSPKW